MKKTIEPNSAEYPYETIVRGMIAREDELLFAAVGFSIGNLNASRGLLALISSLGLATSLLGTIAMALSAHAQRRLILWWRTKRPENYGGPGVIGAEPRDKWILSVFITPWILIGFCTRRNDTLSGFDRRGHFIKLNNKSRKITGNLRALVACHCCRSDDRSIRIISARKVDKREAAAYGR